MEDLHCNVLRRLHPRFVRLSTSPWFVMTTFMFFLSIGYLCVGMPCVSWCMRVCKENMTDLHVEGRENMDPSSGKNN